MQTYEAHPLAARYPMMPDDELADLAADIKANGQKFPIVLGEHEGKQVIVDGRNRLEACRRAGVAPTFVQLNGEDVVAFILSANDHRRHMGAGQRAMARAFAYPEPQQGKRSKTSLATKEVRGFSDERLSKARAVLRASLPLAEEVIAGVTSLDKAYDQVQSDQGKKTNKAVRIRALREVRPDLADSVTQEIITIEAAEQKAQAEAEDAKRRRWSATNNICQAVAFLDVPPEMYQQQIEAFDPAQAEANGQPITIARLRHVADFIAALAASLKESDS